MVSGEWRSLVTAQIWSGRESLERACRRLWAQLRPACTVLGGYPESIDSVEKPPFLLGSIPRSPSPSDH